MIAEVEKGRSGEASPQLVSPRRRKPMPDYVLIVDFFGFVLAIVGFCMAFRQTAFRRLLGRPVQPPTQLHAQDAADDPLTYILRIAGIMIMIFGVVIGAAW
jgi:hypothetical protein